MIKSYNLNPLSDKTMNYVNVHEDTKNGNSVLIQLAGFLEEKIGRIKKIVLELIAANPSCKIFILDFTDVQSTSDNVRRMELLAEVMQEHPELTWKTYYGSPEEPFGLKKNFERVQMLLEKRTVRVAYGNELVNELHDTENPGEVIKEYEEKNNIAGAIVALRFRDEKEKKAYLRALSDMDGWEKYSVIDEEFPDAAKAITPEDA